MNSKKGFTLIELLIVVGIIGLLTSVVLVFLTGAKQKGNDTSRINALAEVRKALQLYATDKGGFPSSTSTLITTGYIKTINPAVIYVGRNSNGSRCVLPSCPSYFLAVPLTSVTNKVLLSDSDGSVTGLPPGYDGKTRDCLTGSGTPELCYDIVP